MFVEIDDFKLHYQVVGEGRPILFLHGLYGISDGMMEIFEPIFAKLDGWKRIYLDSPGNGKSDSPDWMRRSDQVLDAVEKFIDKILSGESFVLVGYSYGGYLSLGLIHRRPEQIDGILLVCPLVEPDESLRRIPKSEIRKVNREYFESLETDAQKGLAMSGVVVLDSELFDRADKIYTPAFRAANTEFLNRIKLEGYKFSFDIYNPEELYELPALILTGRQDNSVGYLDALKLESRFTRGTFVLLDAAGHGLPLDQDEVFTALVYDWIERYTAIKYDMEANKAIL